MKTKINSYLASNTNNSMMRLILLIVTISILLMVFLITISSVIAQFRGHLVNWAGVSTYIGAIALIFGTAITGKVTQKSKEIQNNGTDKIN